SQWLPELEAAYKAKHSERSPFEVAFSSPEDTGLIRVSSESTQDSAGEVRAIHSELLNLLNNRHGIQIDDERKRIEARISSESRTLDALKQSPEAGQAVAEVMQKQVELEGELASLSSSELMMVGRESVERVAPNRKVLVVLAGVAGVIFGI